MAAVILSMAMMLTAPGAQAHPGSPADPASVDREAAKRSAAQGAQSATSAGVADILGAPDAMGIGVVDVEAAKAGLTNATGVSWRPNRPTENAAVLYPNGVVMILDFNVGISVEGPPYLVLDEVHPQLSPWQASENHSSYHLMYIVPDIAATSAALEARGLPRMVTASVVENQDFAVAYAIHRGVNGINIEVIDDDFGCPLIDNCENLLP
ncbi:VOC family protein [Actinokineospora alba]|uniref:hypothetical protein n=1 Tax=Actinokineospora alba TaxID=504798 RepID=UPI000B89E7A7|nr:hypothetical protein [Actinokineospora alba]